MSELQGLVANRFQVDRLAGSGGMGSVYRAWDQQTGSTVALKVLHPEAASQANRFEQEARLLSQLDHPGIVKLVDFGSLDAGRSYLAMEWLEGDSLSDHLKGQLLGIADTLRLAELIAEALGAAHELGVVHRDLKPGNIFLVDRAIERVKLLDFGMAHTGTGQGERLTHTGALLGTPAYMAPEQVRAAKSVGPPADVYALGGVIYRCLTGRYLFQGETPMQMAIAAVMEQAPSLSSSMHGAPPELEALMTQLLAKDPAERPPDGKAAAQALREIAAGRKPAVRPTTSMPAVAEGRCLVVARPPAADDPNAPKLSDVRALASQHQAELQLLADGTALMLMEQLGSLAEQAARAARCALGFRGLAPTVGIALVAEQIADDQTRLAAQAGIGLLDETSGSEILLNELAARMLAASGLDVRQSPRGPVLDGTTAPSNAAHGSLAFAPTMQPSSTGPIADGPQQPASQPAHARLATPVAAQPTPSSGPPVVAPAQAPMPVVQQAPMPHASPAATPPGPFPGAPPSPLAPAPSTPSKPPWLLVGIGVAGLALIVLVLGGAAWWYGSTAGSDDADRSGRRSKSKKGSRPKSRDPTWTPGPGSPYAGMDTCPQERCAPFKAATPARFEPVDAIAAVVKQARALESSASLTMINIPELSGGAVDLTKGETVQYNFHAPRASAGSSLMAIVAHGSIMVSRDEMASAFGTAPIAPPKCKLADAWKTAQGHGLRKNAKVGVNYLGLGARFRSQAGPMWQFSAVTTGSGMPTAKMWRMDGATCAWIEGH